VVSELASINEVDQRRARLVLRRVRRVQFPVPDISVCDQPPGSTQHGQPFMGIGAMSTRQTAVTPCGWRVKACMVCVWVAGKTV